MKRLFLLAALLVSQAAAPATAYPAPDCALYETAYDAVAPQLAEARVGNRTSVFATMAIDRAHAPGFGKPKALEGGQAGPISDLAGCPALIARIEASGAPVKFSRPPVLRQVDGPHVEAFSRTVAKDGKLYVTYYIGRDAGVDVLLARDEAGDWKVVSVQSWETIIVT